MLSQQPKIITKRPELLAPAGDMERLEMALHYGADAVYLAGQRFGMRASAGNFSEEELRKAVEMAHNKNVAVHVTCNILPHEDDLKHLPSFLEMVQDAGVDALIIADMGVFDYAKKYAPNVSRHVSTQLGVVNSATAEVMYNMGADRVVLARETTMEEIRKIRANTPKELEIEAFVHGAMCVSFSGRCLLSNYLTGRDANRGACAQPCRWKYHLVEEKRPGQYLEISEDGGTHIMNSNDLCMLEHIPELIEAGVDSFKIEGRMKSAYYAAASTNLYRHAIDFALNNQEIPEIWLNEKNMISHRTYSTGFFYGYPGQHYEDNSYFSDAEVCAVIEECDDNGYAKCSQRNRFFVGDELDLMTADHDPVRFKVKRILDDKGNEIDCTPHSMMTFYIDLPFKCDRLSMLRKIKSED